MPGDFLFSQAPSGAFIFLLLYIQNIADLYVFSMKTLKAL